jgi:hypothetical protein
MGPDAIARVERLLRETRFEPPQVLPLHRHPLFAGGRWRPVSLLFGLGATLGLILLLYAFWTVLLGFRR